MKYLNESQFSNEKEKSRQDWTEFKKVEQIEDELASQNKGKSRFAFAKTVFNHMKQNLKKKFLDLSVIWNAKHFWNALITGNSKQKKNFAIKKGKCATRQKTRLCPSILFLISTTH
jgi:hypothetical protein